MLSTCLVIVFSFLVLLVCFTLQETNATLVKDYKMVKVTCHLIS